MRYWTYLYGQVFLRGGLLFIKWHVALLSHSNNSMPNYPSLRDKCAVITGAGEGIGFSIAELLVRQGTRVVLNDIDRELAQRAERRLNKLAPHSAVSLAGDAGDVTHIDELIEAADEHFGGADLVVPNAGITLFNDFLDFEPDAFDRVLAVNMRGGFFLIQRMARYLVQRGRRGRAVLMSSNVGLQAYPTLSAYAMTKAALQMLARNLVAELAPHGITVNAVAPGATLTERTRFEQQDYAGTWGALVPRGRAARPQDIAEVVAFLLSEASGHIVGQTLVVDGGWTATSPLPDEAHADSVIVKGMVSEDVG